MPRLVHVGLRNYIPAERVLSCESAGQAWVQRLLRAARRGETGATVLDLTAGRRTRGVLFLDTGHIALVALSPQTIGSRLTAARR